MGDGKQANEHTLPAMLSKAFLSVCMCGKKFKCELFLIKKGFWKDRQTALHSSYVVKWEYQLHIDPHAELCTHTL